MSIDGELVGDNVNAAIMRMRGPAGSAVHLSVRRNGEVLPLEFVLQRAQVEVHSVTAFRLTPRIGYVRIAHFSATTAQDFRRAIYELTTGPHRLAGGVIDLRNNPGGVLEAAVEVADSMLDAGTIVSADGRTAEARFQMSAQPGDMLAGVPAVVLVNGASASAAEFLAGALQDKRRAALMGRKTFGKGSVQTIMPLSQGRAIKLTTSHYYTPSGRSIDGRGIEPDIALDGPDPTPVDLTDQGARATLVERDADVAAALATFEHAPAARSPRRLTARLR
jgi:carboxyl-terminal processing protease